MLARFTQVVDSWATQAIKKESTTVAKKYERADRTKRDTVRQELGLEVKAR